MGFATILTFYINLRVLLDEELIQKENLWSCRNILEIYTKLYKKDEEFQ